MMNDIFLNGMTDVCKDIAAKAALALWRNFGGYKDIAATLLLHTLKVSIFLPR